MGGNPRYAVVFKPQSVSMKSQKTLKFIIILEGVSGSLFGLHLNIVSY
jgi:hypothetical protein